MKTKLFYALFFTILLSQAQVSLVKDINSGINGGIISQFYANVTFDNKLVFTASDGATNGIELWMSDGTQSGTQMISDIFPGVGSSLPNNFVEWQNELIFTANISNVSIRKNNLFTTNLTTTGTTNLISGLPVSAPFLFSNELFFTANGDLFKLPNINATYQQVNTVNFSGNFELASIFNGLIIFKFPTAFNQGDEVWATNGSSAGAYLLKDINPGSNSSSSSNFKIFNNKLYFTANDGTSIDIWETDGTTLGTQKTSLTITGFPIPSGTFTNINNLFVHNNELYFTATSTTNGNELIKMDTNGALTLLEIVNGNGGSFPSGFTIFNNEIYFSADDGVNGIELWKTDGTQANTVLVKNINTSTESTPQGFLEYFGELYFNADDGVHGRELWKTDGTNAGTVMVDDINTGALSSEPLNLIVAGDNLFFSATTTATGRELYKYSSPALSLEDFNFQKIKLYPNPTQNFFSIKFKGELKKIDIYNIESKLVKQFKQENDIYRIEDLQTGIYFVKVTTNLGASIKKIIKE